MGKKRVFIIHGWGGTSDGHWIPWLKSELEKRGIFAKAPQMKDTDWPDPKEWVTHISRLVENHHSDCYLVGHSLGANAIIRYLSTLKKGQTIAGVVFVAPYTFNDPELTEEQKVKMKDWIAPLNFSSAQKHADRFVSIFSDNDESVQVEDSEIFKKKLGSRVIVEHNKGHFTSEDGVEKLQTALDALLSFIK